MLSQLLLVLLSPVIASVGCLGPGTPGSAAGLPAAMPFRPAPAASPRDRAAAMDSGAPGGLRRHRRALSADALPDLVAPENTLGFLTDADAAAGGLRHISSLPGGGGAGEAPRALSSAGRKDAGRVSAPREPGLVMSLSADSEGIAAALLTGAGSNSPETLGSRAPASNGGRTTPGGGARGRRVRWSDGVGGRPDAGSGVEDASLGPGAGRGKESSAPVHPAGSSFTEQRQAPAMLSNGSSGGSLLSHPIPPSADELSSGDM